MNVLFGLVLLSWSFWLIIFMPGWRSWVCMSALVIVSLGWNLAQVNAYIADHSDPDWAYWDQSFLEALLFAVIAGVFLRGFSLIMAPSPTFEHSSYREIARLSSSTDI